MSNPEMHEFTSAADAETTAKLRTYASPPQEVEKVLVREWPKYGRATADSLYETLYALDSVTDPKVDGQTISGTYRQANLRIEHDPNESAGGGVIVVQTLIEGWVKSAEALPAAQVVTDKDALLSPHALDVTSSETVRIRVYRGIDPDYAQTLAEDITLGSGIIARWVEKQDDGSARLYEQYDAKTWAGDENTYSKRVYDQYGDGTDGALDVVKGRIVDVWTHIPETSIGSISSGLEKWALDTKNLDTPTSGYYIERIEMRIDGAGFGEVTRVQVKVDNAAPSTGEAGQEVTVGNPAARELAGKYIIYKWHNVPTSKAAAALAALQTPPTNYLLAYARIVGNRETDAFVTIEQRVEALNITAAANGFFTAGSKVHNVRPSVTVVKEWRGLSEAASDNLVTALGTDTHAPGGYKTIEYVVTHDAVGKHTVRATYGLLSTWADGDGGARLTTGNIVRKVLEKQHYPSAADGYRWRVITETLTMRWSSSNSNAISHISGGVSGSEVRFLGNGEWLAIKMVSRSPGSWVTTAYTE
jgi:hypothetical protein